MSVLNDLAVRAGIVIRSWVDAGRDERGDVPGWVLVTLMTALLVVGLLAVASDRLVELFNKAMDMVG